MRYRFCALPNPARLAVLLSALALWTAGGCVPVSHTSVSSVGGEALGAQLDAAPNPDRVAALAGELRALGPGVAPDEAAAVANLAVYYSEQLAESYDMVRPVELHNVLVNMKLRRGGLCYEMAECMLAELRELPLRTLELRRGIAWKDDLWNEHNCVVVTAVGGSFQSGVVLDAWRNGGRLRWAPVRMDHYPWQPKPAPPSETVLAFRTRPGPRAPEPRPAAPSEVADPLPAAAHPARRAAGDSPGRSASNPSQSAAASAAAARDGRVPAHRQ